MVWRHGNRRVFLRYMSALRDVCRYAHLSVRAEGCFFMSFCPKIKTGGIDLLKKCCDFLVSNMAVFVVLIGVVGAIWPWTLQWAAPYVGWLLGIVMFGMGMTLTVADFKTVFKRPWEVLIGVFAQFLIMPLVAWGLVRIFALPPELAIGVILVGTCPGGTASNVISYLAKGDVALSVSMTMATTLLAPIVTPALTWFLAGAWIHVSFFVDDDFYRANGPGPGHAGLRGSPFLCPRRRTGAAGHARRVCRHHRHPRWLRRLPQCVPPL